MEYKNLLKNIDTYEMALLDTNLTQSNFSIFMEKLNISRNKLFYMLADEATKKDKVKQILIDETLQYIRFSACLMCFVQTDAQFNNCIQHLTATYKLIQEFDRENIVYNFLIKQIREVISQLRACCTDKTAYKTNQLYILQNNLMNEHEKAEVGVTE